MGTDDGAFTHVIADLTGVTAPALRDATALTGLLIAAAGAAGFSTVGAPVVRQLPDGSVAGVLFLDACHITLRTLPERDTLLLDILAPATPFPWAAAEGRTLSNLVRRLVVQGVEQRRRTGGGESGEGK